MTDTHAPRHGQRQMARNVRWYPGCSCGWNGTYAYAASSGLEPRGCTQDFAHHYRRATGQDYVAPNPMDTLEDALRAALPHLFRPRP
jgi:hypothetical protein